MKYLYYTQGNLISKYSVSRTVLSVVYAFAMLGAHLELSYVERLGKILELCFLILFHLQIIPTQQDRFVCSVSRGDNRHGGLIHMKQKPTSCSKIICNGLLNRGTVQLY